VSIVYRHSFAIFVAFQIGCVDVYVELLVGFWFAVVFLVQLVYYRV
jgi:hypothetical protein